MEDAPRRILIIDTAWLGDVVFSTSLIGAVRNLWPRAEIHMVVAPRGEPIVRHHGALSRVWVLDKRGRHRTLRDLLRFGGVLRQFGFDLILNAHPSLRSRLLTAWINAPVRVGYRGWASNLCHTHVIPNDLAVESDHVERRIALLRALGYSVKAEPLAVQVDESDNREASRFLEENDLAERRLLGIIPGSAWETKRWHSKRFAEIAERWLRKPEHGVLIFGGKSEAETLERIGSEGGRGAIPVLNAPIPLVAALLSKCSVVLGNDTGVSFLAIAAGCPRVLVLYGCTQVDYTFPPPHQAIAAGAPCCLPRTGHGAHRCRWGDEPWCMSQITVERVWAAIERARDD
ncbi:MAG: glycosyltransferase family 9 protein [bacterium]|nr:glycosyltransferase family 9 protein [bacterium]